MCIPVDAKKVLDEIWHSGFKPSGFEYRMAIQGYERLGLFDEMSSQSNGEDNWRPYGSPLTDPMVALSEVATTTNDEHAED